MDNSSIDNLDDSPVVDNNSTDRLNIDPSMGNNPIEVKNGNCTYCKKETHLACLECSKTFCNDVSNGKSHIVYHLVLENHKRMSLDGQPVKCVNCGESNVFRLGMESSGELVRRLMGLKLEKENDNINNIDSINKNTVIIEKLVKNLNKFYCGHCRDLPRVVADKTLSFYPSTVSPIEVRKITEGHTPRLYFTAESYLNTFIPLINAEMKKEREIKEGMRQEGVIVRFEGGYCTFEMNRSQCDLRVSVGDEVRLTSRQWGSYRGYVCEEQFSEMIRVRLNESSTENHKISNNGGNINQKISVNKISINNTNKNINSTNKNNNNNTNIINNSTFTVEFIWNPSTYERMKQALIELYAKRKTSKIFPLILKGSKELTGEAEILDPPSLAPLNDSQRMAVRAALTRTITLVQGPPGTGKTVVSAAIVFNLVRVYAKRVLVVAPSNTAADQLASKIHGTGLKVLRVMSRRREDAESEVEFLCLHRLVREFSSDQASVRQALVKAAEVVVCTCVTAGQRLLRQLDFPFVLIDEACQATEPLSLVPCAYDPHKLILVGDHKQLGPTVLSKDVARLGLRQSLFERLLRIGVMPYLLSVQYRMHPDLCVFPSEYFYAGLLQSGTHTDLSLDIPNNFFYVCDCGKEEVSPSKTSFLNKGEAALVENIVRYLFKNGVLEQQIGVITPYEGQRAYILSQIFGNEAGNLEIKNVDGFQGREKDFIIVSLVRSNVFQGVGFVGDKRRMNVTLTRAKHGLIIVGNPFTLYKNKIWADLLDWYDKQGRVYEGPLNALRRVRLSCDTKN